MDECFGYVPLLGLGGTEKVENLQKVRLLNLWGQHLSINISMMPAYNGSRQNPTFHICRHLPINKTITIIGSAHKNDQ